MREAHEQLMVQNFTWCPASAMENTILPCREKLMTARDKTAQYTAYEIRSKLEMLILEARGLYLYKQLRTGVNCLNHTIILFDFATESHGCHCKHTCH